LAHVLIHAVTIGTRGNAVPATRGELQYRRSGEKPGAHKWRANWSWNGASRLHQGIAPNNSRHGSTDIPSAGRLATSSAVNWWTHTLQPMELCK